MSTTFFTFFQKNLETYFFTILQEKEETFTGKDIAVKAGIFILGPYLQKEEENLASQVLSKRKIRVILSL